jgi:hypothetical protein
MLEMGGIFLKTIWMYLCQLPGTVIIWLISSRKKTLEITYRENAMASGLIGLFLMAIVSFLIIRVIH